MPTSITNVLNGIGLSKTGAALESDLASLITSTTPEGILAKLAVGSVLGGTISGVARSVLRGHKKSKHHRSRSRKSRRSRTVRHSHMKHGMRIGSRKWMAYIRRMRKKH